MMTTYQKGLQCQIPGLSEMYLRHFGYKTDGWFVEVGAFDGVKWSNTSGLLEAGWSGVYFEPQSQAFADLQRNHGGNPRAHLVNKAVADFTGTTYIYLGGSISTISEATKETYLGIGGFNSTGLAANESEVVQVTTLDIELERLSVPTCFDLLSVDVEGSEMAVLRGFSIDKWKPKMVIIEAHEGFPDERLSRKAHEINAYMVRNTYHKIYSDHINNIYIW